LDVSEPGSTVQPVPSSARNDFWAKWRPSYSIDLATINLAQDSNWANRCGCRLIKKIYTPHNFQGVAELSDRGRKPCQEILNVRIALIQLRDGK
jgi:hypothetical protein